IFAEREGRAEGDVRRPQRAAGDVAARVRKAAEPRTAQVGEEILPYQRGRPSTAIHEPADDRAAVLVRVLHGRRLELRGIAVIRDVAVRSFHDPPAVVEAGPGRG